MGTFTYSAGAAGSVTVSSNGTTLTVVSVSPASGWTPEVETASGPQVEVTFENGNDRIDFKAEINNGQIVTEVRVR